MKKILLLIAMFTVGLTLTACNLVGDVTVDPECTSLQELVDGKCTDIVVDECPVGEVKDANGDCVPEVVDVTCATGEEKVNDECVPVCGTDQTRINGVCTDNPPVLDSLVLSGTLTGVTSLTMSGALSGVTTIGSS